MLEQSERDQAGHINIDDTVMAELKREAARREHGVSRICTRDAYFSRFPFLEVVDPVRG